MENRNVLDIFVSRGMIDSSLAEDMLHEMDASGKDVGDILTDFQVVQSREDMWGIIAQELGADLVDLSEFLPPEELLAVIPAAMARLHGALPINFDAEGITVALLDPMNPQTPEDLRFALGKEVKVVVAPDYIIEKKINEAYGGGADEGAAMAELLGELDTDGKELSDQELADEANSAPIVRYVDLVIYQAIKERASDIHFEPFEKDFKIRYRVDGSLYEMAPPPIHLALPILSRVKVMSNMNIAERRVPQDGRIVKQIGDQQVDLRVSSLPTSYGESVVLRVLDRSNVNMSLSVLGLPQHVEDYVNTTIKKPNGIFVVTGPTGAGKTTTLYAALKEINTIDTKLLTAEDPVEYDIDGIIQVPVNEAIDLSFARILRAFLRQ
ncbi:MAG: GspE/PulE family protein, partial [Roseibacillus sp.]